MNKNTIDKKNKEEETIRYKLRFIDSFQFLLTFFENVTDNLSDSIHKKKFLNCKCSIMYKQKMSHDSTLAKNVRNTQNLKLVVN